MKRLIAALILAAAAVATTGCATLMTMIGKGPTKPAASEFGLGPRAGSLYTATLEPPQPLRPRKLQTVQVRIMDASGQPVDGATITIDGGMPQHGHGLPTRPRVTRHLGAGVYQIEGVRFNMGGWWEFKLAISTPAGSDRVTFNLAL
jgi:hypothetical protein